MDVRLKLSSLSFDKSSSQSSSPILQSCLFFEESQLGIGEVERFEVKFLHEEEQDHLLQRDSDGTPYIWLRVRNHENNLFRPIYITGPFSLYIDVTPHNYSHLADFKEVIQYDDDVKPGQSFKAKLYLSESSRIDCTNWYGWTVDVVSQLTLATAFHIAFRFGLAYDYDTLRRYKGTEVASHQTSLNKCQVTKFNTHDLWNAAPSVPENPSHLVMITHGIFSNIGADMLYLRDQILKTSSPESNVIVRGFDGNVGKSDHGIRYLGKRVAEYTMQVCKESRYEIDRISFVGHSLGGPVQAYAITYIVNKDPKFFDKIKPQNFIIMASPMLGITEFPKFVSMALDVGLLGRTGRDLMLRHKFPSLINKSEDAESHRSLTSKPVMEQIMTSKSAHKVFAQFSNRTLYANAINDGIVPLRTSALLYLDWKSLGNIKEQKEKYEHRTQDVIQHDENSADKSSSNSNNNVENLHVKGSTIAENPHREMNSSDGKPTLKLRTTSTSIFQEASQKQRRKKLRKYIRTQTTGSPIINDAKGDDPFARTEIATPDSDASKLEQSENSQDSNDDLSMNIPPVASTILAAANVLISPEPNQEFLSTPSSRFPAIFHDRMYSYKDLPPQHYISVEKVANPIKKMLFKKKRALQESIARSWHRDMDWRKVLVTLRPDAHNNIAVRRKYVNAWGWEVVDHMVNNHFA